MKLSEAIRLGCKKSEQLKSSDLFFINHETGEIKACALGAALLGSGYSADYSAPYSELNHIFPELNESVKYDEYKEFETYYSICYNQLQWFIIFLNDRTGMSREEIADVVESLGY